MHYSSTTDAQVEQPIGQLRQRPCHRLREDDYPTLEDNSAALLHALVRNHALVDGS